ncbi:RNHCP domain-containing protein [Enterococcus rivorum]|uniref:RNHCP domain-containing protein n=1 Tax=Enterococcus rivorum TaxID=762845 RepID=A0A1E5KWT3_9ENTE|nr:RNHCP domain-containing protein [Enterococcus rivorum]MBP2097320.1 DNA-directed RNA polymerase subunit RPC12/RpoP [Enterococcus rivorum]OEH82330.1 RNHCP domain-containing protein [Enterococcus rivorum]
MRSEENCHFICNKCGAEVLALTNGSYRNHCPFCLHSVHVDVSPGDRTSHCLGLMSPTEYRYHTKKGYQIKHVCSVCGKEQWNKIAENTQQNDLFIEWLEQDYSS